MPIISTYENEEWNDLENLIPGSKEYIEYILINLKLYKFNNIYINKNQSGSRRPKDKKYIKYNINNKTNSTGIQKIFTIYISKYDKSIKLKFWYDVSMKEYEIDDLKDLKRQIDNWLTYV